VLRSRNFLFELQLRLWLSTSFRSFRKEYRLDSLFWSYWILIMIEYTSLVWPGAGAGSRSRNFSLPAPAPAKSSGSLRLQLRLHNTGRNQGPQQGYLFQVILNGWHCALKNLPSQWLNLDRAINSRSLQIWIHITSDMHPPPPHFNFERCNKVGLWYSYFIW
jgi:hypothetical protein